MDFLSIPGAVKEIVEIIKQIRDEVDKSKRHSAYFRIRLLEKIHEGMCLVHGIYLNTFREAAKQFDEKDASIQSLLKFLSDRDLETHLIRDDLHGLLWGAQALQHLPQPVHSYIAECERYFGHVTDAGIRSRLRGFLHKLRKIDDLLNTTVEQLGDIEKGYLIDHIHDDVRNSLKYVPFEIREIWPEVAAQYHAAHLALAQTSKVDVSDVQWDAT